MAKFQNGSRAEKDIDLRIVVEDENDCPPVFNLTTGAVYERSAIGTAIIHHTSETIMKLAYPGSLQTLPIFLQNVGVGDISNTINH